MATDTSSTLSTQRDRAITQFSERVERLRKDHARIYARDDALEVRVVDWEMSRDAWVEAIRCAFSHARAEELSFFRRDFRSVEVTFNGRLVLCFE